MDTIKSESINIEKQRKKIRKESRARRRALSLREQTLAAHSLQKIIRRQPFFLRSRTLGYYIANDNEINPAIIPNLNTNKKFYLPVLQPLKTGKLLFLFHDSDKPSSLKLNRFGIPEPRNVGNPIPRFALDVVFMPLVAFDKFGGRLGMGGGFYDRSFAFKKNNVFKKPLLIGLAHHCQEWQSLPTESWDIPLNAVITDTGICPCSSSIKESKRDFLLSDLHR